MSPKLAQLDASREVETPAGPGLTFSTTLARLDATPAAAGPGGSQLQVTEPEPYRFDDTGNLTTGTHEFCDDLRSAFGHGSPGQTFRGGGAAYQRALGFIQKHIFAAVTTTNVAPLNPNIQRDDLYADERQYRYPLWEAVRKGTLDEITPFTVPKWSSSSGLVAAHVQDTETSEGAFATTSEPITPAAVSGKLRLSRELWDQKARPLVSAILWNKLVQVYTESLEAAVVTELNAESPGATITLTTAGADAVTADELAAALADLRFVRGGYVFDALALQVDLYKKLARAKDGSGRYLFPVTTVPVLNVHGVDGFPSWALAGTGSVAANSYLFDRAAVAGLASVPERLELEYQVKSVELAIWGYQVVEVLDNAGVRRVVYDPV